MSLNKFAVKKFAVYLKFSKLHNIIMYAKLSNINVNLQFIFIYALFVKFHLSSRQGKNYDKSLKVYVPYEKAVDKINFDVYFQIII